jgi:hypothetical protein
MIPPGCDQRNVITDHIACTSSDTRGSAEMRGTTGHGVTRIERESEHHFPGQPPKQGAPVRRSQEWGTSTGPGSYFYAGTGDRRAPFKGAKANSVLAPDLFYGTGF